MANSQYSPNNRFWRGVTSFIAFASLGVIKPADNPAPTSNGPAIVQPATPGLGSNSSSAPPEAPFKPVGPQPGSAQASPSKDQQPGHHRQASSPANRDVVGPAHDRQSVHGLDPQNTDPANRQDHPESSLLNPAQEMVRNGEGIDDIERQQLRDRDRRRPLLEPTPATGLVEGRHPQQQGPQAQRQYSDFHNRGPQYQGPQRQGQYSDSQNRGPQNRGPQNQHPGNQSPKGSKPDGNGHPPRRPPSK